ncbi:3-dehydro-L-gulonate 2-dehydrogenase [Maribacter sp. CXY002]|uniref:3-dehydro-L-gulonate 2-dehydrogenase n=1 Tax=Maribacter luteocoastalis TaxID=3407671 RepID=UPI003B672CF0
MELRVDAKEMQTVLNQLFLKYGFSENKAILLSETFTENTLAGINSHGVNRVPVFIEYIKNGIVKIDAEAKKVQTFGTIERWDGGLGPGIVNARKCTSRAIKLAKKHGMGLVALRNTNHWMRAGAYGWQAAEAGCISILFTNTKPNMPAWGGKDSRIGNNPFVVSIPRNEGHVVLDMSLSQFSFGKIHEYDLKGQKLPYVGGWDKHDQLTKDPKSILGNERGLPIGYWKGSALSMVLDMLATLLSAGSSTYKISSRVHETGVSQIFLCIYPKLFGDDQLQQQLVDEIITYTHDVAPMKPGDRTYYPGERALANTIENSKNGMTINKEIWESILAL